MMRIIKVGFSSPKKTKIGAELIKLWINKPYSHVYMNWIDDQGRDIIFQASHGCVHIILKDNFKLNNDIHKEVFLDLTEEQYQSLRDFCYHNSGSLYSFSDLFIIIIYDLAIRCGFKPIFENVEGFICSELISLALRKVLNLKLQKPSYLMRPDDVENLLESHIWND